MNIKFDYYFLGIGGISMSALARLLYEKGYNVGGYDRSRSAICKRLKNSGISVNYFPNLKAIERSQTIVYSAAIDKNDYALQFALKLGKRIISRGKLLGEIASKYKNVIAISGSHGKTTTTALISHIFRSASLNCTLHIGGQVLPEKENLIVGSSNIFITEACEYKDNFLFLKPQLSVILNIEPDHLDYFKNFDNIKSSFAKFASFSQSIVIGQEAFNQIFSLCPELEKKAIIIGKDICAQNIVESQSGIEFDVIYMNKFLAHISSPLQGRHNAENILASIACAKAYSIDNGTIKKALASFQGVARRYEKVEYKKALVVFDYAHHYSQIRSVIQTARQYADRLIVIFQPHTYSRTKNFFGQFVSCFDGADQVYIFKTYAAREKFDKSGDGKTLAKALKERNMCKVSYSKDYALLTKLKIGKGDIVLVLGAGDFYDKCKM